LGRRTRRARRGAEDAEKNKGGGLSLYVPPLRQAQGRLARCWRRMGHPKAYEVADVRSLERRTRVRRVSIARMGVGAVSLGKRRRG